MSLFILFILYIYCIIVTVYCFLSSMHAPYSTRQICHWCKILLGNKSLVEFLDCLGASEIETLSGGSSQWKCILIYVASLSSKMRRWAFIDCLPRCDDEVEELGFGYGWWLKTERLVLGENPGLCPRQWQLNMFVEGKARREWGQLRDQLGANHLQL